MEAYVLSIANERYYSDNGGMNHQVRFSSEVVITASREGAHQLGMQIAMKRFPVSDGWTKHQSIVCFAFSELAFRGVEIKYEIVPKGQ